MFCYFSGHPKIKLFITQGGLQSTDESIAAGVPLIAFPILGDQWYNAEKYVHYGIGMKMEVDTISEETLTEAINQVIQNKRLVSRYTGRYYFCKVTSLLCKNFRQQIKITT